MLTIELDKPLAASLLVGMGVVQVLEGRINKGAELKFFAGDAQLPEQSVEYFPIDDDYCSFHAQFKWRPESIGQRVFLSAELTLAGVAGAMQKFDLGEQQLLADQAVPITISKPQNDVPLVVICMATYNPPSKPLQRQIETILAQTHQNWLLLVVDDGSDAEHIEAVQSICSADQQRIQLLTHAENKGFYGNFERALSYVPLEAQYVAFADQDDLWYPDKLQKLIAAIESEQAVLAYSDMRIVMESGEVVAQTYWQGRKNEYQDMTTVFLANTVTGAAALFKRELLAPLLPFPERIGDAFHDHWLALVAMQSGKLAYVDAPLYDYYQYGRSVIGHCDFTRWSLAARLKSVLKIGLRLLKPKQSKQWLGQKIGAGCAIYRGECLRLLVFSKTLKLRLGLESKLPFLHPLNLSNGGVGSFVRYMLVHVKILISGKTTDDAEFRLGMAYLARAYQRWKA